MSNHIIRVGKTVYDFGNKKVLYLKMSETDLNRWSWCDDRGGLTKVTKKHVVFAEGTRYPIEKTARLPMLAEVLETSTEYWKRLIEREELFREKAALDKKFDRIHKVLTRIVEDTSTTVPKNVRYWLDQSIVKDHTEEFRWFYERGFTVGGFYQDTMQRTLSLAKFDLPTVQKGLEEILPFLLPLNDGWKHISAHTDADDGLFDMITKDDVHWQIARTRYHRDWIEPEVYELKELLFKISSIRHRHTED